ncbi:MAG: class I SAM-dependent methyltransferase [Candidatus Thioglobus sp.]|nr:class I SAM-dependent methyltransferase [Candidatus Thioglobus sp.]
MTAKCPLCFENQVQIYCQNNSKNDLKDYLHCQKCDLVFAEKAFHLSKSEEKARYDLHQNNSADLKYRQFLSQVFDPVIQLIPPNSKGLDFGSGPGPTLSEMFSQRGFSVDLFDKFYANNPAIFANKYDFITATEVAEHLAEPGFELGRLYEMLEVGGILALMTKMLNPNIDFKSWYYKDDPTHICFFSERTMRFLAKFWGAKVEFQNENVVLFFKQN